MFSIIGNGKWGQAIANHLVQKYPVELIGRQIKVNVSSDIEQQTTGLPSYDTIIYAGPASLAPKLMAHACQQAQEKTCLLFAKGMFASDKLSSVSSLYEWCLPFFKYTATIQGPSFAQELMAKAPTMLVCATQTPALSKRVSEWFTYDSVIMQSSQDPVGVSLAGAFKNPLAILIGYLDAYQSSANLKYAVLTYATEVLSTSIYACGGDPQTAYGYAGLGDLMMTATTDLSRNRRFGQYLAQGYSVEQAKIQIGETIEGIDATILLQQYYKAQGHQVELIGLIQSLISNQLKPQELLSKLMTLMRQAAINQEQQNFVV